ncbi:MAG TPA: hypothetical protein VKZ86_02625 [Cyclobacteriaceae bacterium]|nr:hypothetical protein [Cyclobacteriaceae bacterium]
MNVKANEILLIYNSQKMEDRKVLGYATPVQRQNLKERDISRDPLTETQLKGIANKLGIEVADLVDKQSDAYQDKYRSASMSEHDLLTALKNEPQLMRTPIAVYPEHAEFVESYTFVKKGMGPPDVTSGSANPGEK